MQMTVLKLSCVSTASYAFRPNLNKLFSAGNSSERRGIEIFCRLFSTHQPTTRLQSRYRINPRSTPLVLSKASEYSWRPSTFHVDPWSRGREVARDVLRSLPKPEKSPFFAIGDGSRFLVICFVHTSGQMLFSQTPGRHPPYITGLRVNSVTLGCVGAPNERAPFRVHDAIAVFAAPCLTRTRIEDQGLGGVHEDCAGFAYSA